MKVSRFLSSGILFIFIKTMFNLNIQLLSGNSYAYSPLLFAVPIWHIDHIFRECRKLALRNGDRTRARCDETAD